MKLKLKTKQVKLKKYVRQIDAVINALGVEALMVIDLRTNLGNRHWQSATPAQAQAVHAFIRGHIAAKSQAVADQVIIQYGGSVNDANAAELFHSTRYRWCVVGGASLKAPCVCSNRESRSAENNSSCVKEIKKSG